MQPDRAADDAVAALEGLASPALDPLFRPQARSGVASAWHGHVPFAQWLVGATRPGLIVELGTHNGVSYSAFCETVLRERLATRCYAVDSWAGDEHAGHYGETVYAALREFHDGRYGGFSELLRMTFDEARDAIPDGTVDLLHIDGFHSYEAARHDFESWESKLSPRAVVLFHDTNALERGFGVARCWAEIRGRFPAFEFLHGHGLGVLAVGPDVPPAVARLCHLTEPAAIAVLRDRFAALGRGHVLEFTLREAARQQEGRLQREVASRDGEIDRLGQSLAAIIRHRDELEAARASLERALGEVRAEARHQAEDEARIAGLAAEAEAGAAERQRLGREHEAELFRLHAEQAAERQRLTAEADALRGNLAAARADAQAAREPARGDASLPGGPEPGWPVPWRVLRRRANAH